MSDTLFISLLDKSVTSILGGLMINNLMESCKHVAACDMLKHHPSLHEKAPLRDFAGHFLEISCPQEQSWVSALAMYCYEIEISVKSSKCRAYIILHKVRSGWR